MLVLRIVGRIMKAVMKIAALPICLATMILAIVGMVASKIAGKLLGIFLFFLGFCCIMAYTGTTDYQQHFLLLGIAAAGAIGVFVVLALATELLKQIGSGLIQFIVRR